MTEYIEREASLFAQNKSMNLKEMRERLKRIPAADVKPVVRGEWKSLDKIFYCSVCERCFPHKTNYCPNCGADMRGENDG